MKGRTLLIFTENYVRGGGNRYMIDVVNAIHSKYDAIHFISNENAIFQEDLSRLKCDFRHFIVKFIAIGEIYKTISKFPSSLRKLLKPFVIILEPIALIVNTLVFYRIARRHRTAQIIACNGGYPAAQSCISMLLATHLCGNDAVLTIVSTPAARRWYAWPYHCVLDTIVARSTSRIIVNAKSAKISMHGLRNIPLTHMKVIYNGLDDNLGARAQRNDPTIVIGYVGRLDQMKGVKDLFDAFLHLYSKFPTLRLVLAGEGNLKEEILDTVKAAELGSVVSLPGHYTGDIHNLLSTFDVFVFPSYWEGFPYSILEAMRAALPIVATDVGGISEALTTNREALLVPARSTEALIAAIQTLIENPELRRSLAANARNRFLSEFAIERMHENVRAVMGYR